jgi:ABC-type sulfate transport system permease component
LESGFDAAVTLSMLVLGFSLMAILSARYLAQKATEYQG